MTMRGSIVVRALAFACALGACAGAVSATAAPRRGLLDEPLELDTFAQPLVQTSAPLAAGVAYLVSVDGTLSNFPNYTWDDPNVCGAPDPAPKYPSPGTPNGKVGFDAEFLYAAPPFPGRSCASS